MKQRTKAATDVKKQRRAGQCSLDFQVCPPPRAGALNSYHSGMLPSIIEYYISAVNEPEALAGHVKHAGHSCVYRTYRITWSGLGRTPSSLLRSREQGVFRLFHSHFTYASLPHTPTVPHASRQQYIGSYLVPYNQVPGM